MEILLEGLQPGREYKVQVRALNADGIYSAFSAAHYFWTATDTTAPLAPSNLTWNAVGDTFVATWTAPTLNDDGTATEDLDGYAIRITAPSGASVYYGLPADAERFEFTRGDNTAAFGYFQKTLTIDIKSRDTSNNVSTTAATLTSSKPAPAPVTNLVLNYSGSSIVASWTAPTTNSDGTPLVDLLDYNVTVSAAGSTANRTYFATQTSFEFSFEENKAVFGSPKGAVTFTVKARNEVLDESVGTEATSVNPPPAAPTGLSGTVLPDAIDLRWNRNTEDDLLRYDVYSNTTASATGAVFADDTTDPAFLYPTVAYNEDRYFAVKAVDIFGQASAFSAWAGPFRPKTPFEVDTTAPAVTTLTATTSVRPTTDPAAVDLSWPAVTDTDLAGYHIQYSKNITPREWLYHDVVDKTATKTTIEGLASATQYVFQIRSYDTMINTSAWSAEALATSSTSALKEIASEVQVVSGGVLRSENFTEGDPAAVPPIPAAGWRLMPSSLDIINGSVNAAVVRTGQLRSSQTIAVGLPDEGQPWWVIDTEGDAVFRNAKIKGKIIVGNATGGAATDVAIASANYGGTGAQWSIRGDGTFDVKSGTGARLEMSSAGLIGYDGAKTTFNLTNAGALTLDGNLSASGGNFYGNIAVAGHLEVYGTDAYVIARRSGNGAWVMLDGRSGTDYAIDSSTGRFRVTYDGDLNAQNATIAGNITAHSGVISGAFNIGDANNPNGYMIVNGSNGAHFVVDGRSTSSYAAYAHNGTGLTWYISKAGAAYFGGTISIGQVSDGAARSYVDGTFEVPSGAQSKADGAYNNSVGYTNNTAIPNERSATTTITNKSVQSSNFYTGYMHLGSGSPRSSGLRWTYGSTEKAYIDVTLRYVGGSAVYVYELNIWADDGIQLRSSIRSTHNANFNGTYDNGYRVYSGAYDPYAGHTHSYLPLSGGTVTGHVNFNQSINISANCSAAAYYRQGYNWYVQVVSGTGIRIGDSGTGVWRNFSMGGLSSGSTGYPVSSSGKSFVIPHPSPAKKDTNYLVHVSAEGPTADVFYRGEGRLFPDRAGEYTPDRVPRAVVTLPDYFEDLTHVEGRTVTLTPIAEVCDVVGCDKFLPSALAASRVVNGKFTVYQVAGYMHDHARFYWEVKAVRKDIPATEVEPSTEQYGIGGDGPYTYLVPRA